MRLSDRKNKIQANMKKGLSSFLSRMESRMMTDEDKYSRRENENENESKMSVSGGRYKRVVEKMRAFFDLYQNENADENYAEMKKDLSECFEKWIEMQKSHHDYELYECASKAYYKSGEIKDLLQNLKDFTDDIEDESAEDIMREGYNNYLFFIRQKIEKMKAQHYEAEAKEKKGDGFYNVYWFVDEYFNDVACIKELLDAKKAGERLCEESKLFFTKEQLETARYVCSVWETVYTKYDEHEFLKVKEKLEVQKKQLEMKTGKTKALYHTLCDCFTVEWFKKFDFTDENSPIRGMTGAEVENLYRSELKKIDGALRNITA